MPWADCFPGFLFFQLVIPSLIWFSWYEHLYPLSFLSVCVCLLLLGRFLTAWVIGSGCINWWAEAADRELSRPHSQVINDAVWLEDAALMGIMDGPALFQSCAFQANLWLRQGRSGRLCYREQSYPFQVKNKCKITMKWPDTLTIEESTGMLVKKKIFLNLLFLPE